jgi:hypothetical protein
MADSKLNIQIIINEDGVTPDPTHITEHMSITVQAPAVSKGIKYINAGSDARIIKQGYSGSNDAMVVIKNNGTTGFNLHEASSGGSKGNVFGALGPSESMFYRLKKGYDLWATNLSSGSKGSIEFSHWECKENV